MIDEGTWGRNTTPVTEEGLGVSKCRCVLTPFQLYVLLFGPLTLLRHCGAD